MQLRPVTVEMERFEELLSTMSRMKSTFAVQADQSTISVYKDSTKLVYSVRTEFSKDDYITRNEYSFYSTEPIKAKELLRMQQLIMREKRHVCIYAISYSDSDADNFIDLIPVQQDTLLHAYLQSVVK